ncbi:hypothetical protein SAMN04488036_10845 [Shimia haliotis]|jgi:hypothetical protein|uniref:Uncharacterized protein n=1 Tax=Shimia haliotis TaxID=1280847 RepID=A0A1I4GE35_9RHOB|nr:hypothetical protein SAMN04488036_10845 [Shimia haliotis]
MIDIFGAAPRTTWKQTLLLLQRKGTLSAQRTFAAGHIKVCNAGLS